MTDCLHLLRAFIVIVICIACVPLGISYAYVLSWFCDITLRSVGVVSYCVVLYQILRSCVGMHYIVLQLG